MLTILDKYIIRKFLSSFFFICMIFTLVAVVVDFSEKLDDMIEQKATRKEIFFDYYFNFIPYINILLWPLFTLISVIFFTSRLANNTEFIAMLGTGTSFRRLLRPYFIGAFFLMSLHYMASNYLIPQGNKRRVAFENKYIWRNNFTNQKENIHFNLSKNEEAYLQGISEQDSTGRNFSYIRYEGNDVAMILNAQTIRPAKNEAYHWKLLNYEVRTFHGLKETYHKGMEKDTLLHFRASDLIRRDNHKEGLTTPELKAFIEQERSRGASPAIEYEVERFRRTSEPFSIVILAIMGMSVASRKLRGGLGWHLLIGAASGGAFIFMSKFSSSFAVQGGMYPALAVWLPNILFGSLTIWFVNTAQK